MALRELNDLEFGGLLPPLHHQVSQRGSRGAEDEVVREGPLLSKKKNAFRAKWKESYVVLYHDFFTYTSNNKTKSVDLHDQRMRCFKTERRVKSIEDVSMIQSKTPNAALSFVIQINKAEFVFSPIECDHSRGVDDRDEWVRSFKNVANAIHVEQKENMLQQFRGFSNISNSSGAAVDPSSSAIAGSAPSTNPFALDLSALGRSQPDGQPRSNSDIPPKPLSARTAKDVKRLSRATSFTTRSPKGSKTPRRSRHKRGKATHAATPMVPYRASRGGNAIPRGKMHVPQSAHKRHNARKRERRPRTHRKRHHHNRHHHRRHHRHRRHDDEKERHRGPLDEPNPPTTTTMMKMDQASTQSSELNGHACLEHAEPIAPISKVSSNEIDCVAEPRERVMAGRAMVEHDVTRYSPHTPKRGAVLEQFHLPSSPCSLPVFPLVPEPEPCAGTTKDASMDWLGSEEETEEEVRVEAVEIRESPQSRVREVVDVTPRRVSQRRKLRYSAIPQSIIATIRPGASAAVGPALMNSPAPSTITCSSPSTATTKALGGPTMSSLSSTSTTILFGAETIDDERRADAIIESILVHRPPGDDVSPDAWRDARERLRLQEQSLDVSKCFPPDDDWNAKYQSHVEMRESSLTESVVKGLATSNTVGRFARVAQAMARDIVNELIVPQANKTIAPLDDEGRMYVHRGILFRFTKSPIGNKKSSEALRDYIGQKLASQELKGMQAYARANVRGLSTPLTCLVSYGGHVLVATAIFPRHESGEDVLFDVRNGVSDQHIAVLLKDAAASINIKSHIVISKQGTALRCPASSFLTVHSALDGRNYLVNASRTLPLEFPSKETYKKPYQTFFLRAELVKAHSKPLSPDAVTIPGFSKPPDMAQNDVEVAAATQSIRVERIPAFIKRMTENMATSSEMFVRELHDCGINVRHLPLVAECDDCIHPIREMAVVEMVARTCKVILRQFWSQALKAHHQSLLASDDGEPSVTSVTSATTAGGASERLEEELSSITVNFFNLVLGVGDESEQFWRDTILVAMGSKYGMHLPLFPLNTAIAERSEGGVEGVVRHSATTSGCEASGVFGMGVSVASELFEASVDGAISCDEQMCAVGGKRNAAGASDGVKKNKAKVKDKSKAKAKNKAMMMKGKKKMIGILKGKSSVQPNTSDGAMPPEEKMMLAILGPLEAQSFPRVLSHHRDGDASTTRNPNADDARTLCASHLHRPMLFYSLQHNCGVEFHDTDELALGSAVKPLQPHHFRRFVPRTKYVINDTLECYRTADESEEFAHRSHWRKAAQAINIKLQLHTELYGLVNPHVARIVANLSSLYCRIGSYDDALNAAYASLCVARPFTGDSANIYVSAMEILFLKNDVDGAMQCYHHAVHCVQWHLGPMHPALVHINIHLGSLYYHTGSMDKAITYYEEALRCGCMTYGRHHILLAPLLGRLADLYRLLDKPSSGADQSCSMMMSEGRCDVSWRALRARSHQLSVYTREREHMRLRNSLCARDGAGGDGTCAPAKPSPIIGAPAGGFWSLQHHEGEKDVELQRSIAECRFALAEDLVDVGTPMAFRIAACQCSMSLKSYRRYLADSHPAVLNCLNLQAVLAEALGNFHEAQDRYAEVLCTCKSILGGFLDGSTGASLSSVLDGSSLHTSRPDGAATLSVDAEDRALLHSDIRHVSHALVSLYVATCPDAMAWLQVVREASSNSPHACTSDHRENRVGARIYSADQDPREYVQGLLNRLGKPPSSKKGRSAMERSVAFLDLACVFHIAGMM